MKTLAYIYVKYSNVSKPLKMQDYICTIALCRSISERVLPYVACLIVFYVYESRLQPKRAPTKFFASVCTHETI
jgi:hypothetical protein